MPSCSSCKRFGVGMNGVMCNDCWSYFTEKVSMDEIAMMTSCIYHREPNNIQARDIVLYLVGGDKHTMLDAIEDKTNDSRTLPIQTEERKSKLFGIFKK